MALSKETLKIIYEELSYSKNHLKTLRLDAKNPGWKKPREWELKLEKVIEEVKKELDKKPE
jgi:hypothetical protein